MNSPAPGSTHKEMCLSPRLAGERCEWLSLLLLHILHIKNKKKEKKIATTLKACVCLSSCELVSGVVGRATTDLAPKGWKKERSPKKKNTT